MLLLKKAEQILADMQSFIAKAVSKPISLAEKSELALSISIGSWKQMQTFLVKLRFISTEEEIHFFKEIKPRFWEETEYYKRIYFVAATSGAGSDHREQKEFWIHEATRLTSFIIRNSEFYQYYNSGQTNQDVELYTVHPVWHPDYSCDKTKSGYDELKGELLALKKYKAFAVEQLVKHISPCK